MQEYFMNNDQQFELLYQNKQIVQKDNNLPTTKPKEDLQIQQNIISRDDSINIITLLGCQFNYFQKKIPKKIKQQLNKQDKKSNIIRNTKKRIKIRQFEIGFLSPSKQLYEIKKDQNKIQANFPKLSLIFSNSQNEQQFEDLKIFFTFAIHMKSQANRQQWIFIYEQMVKMALLAKQQEIFSQIKRWKWIETKINNLAEIVKKNQKLVFFHSELQQYKKQFEQLLTVQLYCILAQKFNFSINEFYHLVFQNKYSQLQE